MTQSCILVGFFTTKIRQLNHLWDIKKLTLSKLNILMLTFNYSTYGFVINMVIIMVKEVQTVRR